MAFINEVPLFYQDRDGHWFPTLRVLHQYPGEPPLAAAQQLADMA